MPGARAAIAARAPGWCVCASALAAALTQLREGILEKLLGFLVGATLLHVGEVRLVRLGLGESRRVLTVASCGKTRVRVVDGVGDLLFGKPRGEVPHRLVAETVPVRHGDPVR